MNAVTIREIIQADNLALAKIVRESLAEFNAAKPGTVFYDDTTDHLFEVFRHARSWYYVAEVDGTVMGGAGIFPTKGLPYDTCELVKMYLSPSMRGKGLGKTLLEKCIDKARELDFKKIYLESMPELKLAIPLYQKFGFTFLPGPMGDSGHTGCDVWMLKILTR